MVVCGVAVVARNPETKQCRRGCEHERRRLRVLAGVGQPLELARDRYVTGGLTIAGYISILPLAEAISLSHNTECRICFCLSFYFG